MEKILVMIAREAAAIAVREIIKAVRNRRR